MPLRELTLTIDDFVPLFQGGSQQVERTFVVRHDPDVSRSLFPHCTKIAEKLAGGAARTADSGDWSQGRLQVSLHQAQKYLQELEAGEEEDDSRKDLAESVIAHWRKWGGAWTPTIPDLAVVVSKSLQDFNSLEAGEEVEGELGSFSWPRHSPPAPQREDDDDDDFVGLGDGEDDED